MTNNVKRKKRADCKYAEWMDDAIIEVAEEGGFHAAMMLRIGVSKGAFYKYKHEFPSFAESLARADLIIQARQEKLMLEASEGKIKNYNYNANSFILHNRYREDYPKDSNTSITINNNTLNLTSEQRDNKIAMITEKLKLLGIDALNSPATIDQED
ncbi:hypothetical protein UFOVP1_65 [uncultured Caudovirales phage]|uniref:Uncharacterized protein n=1 Tax=uncultured Caudovirales phage TaxID=2100421 RepID=A0A6J5KHJ1_9CAUD|nr:hypothetical protein UFOVP1_65 [uncultured Caudovirales phage]